MFFFLDSFKCETPPLSFTSWSLKYTFQQYEWKHGTVWLKVFKTVMQFLSIIVLFPAPKKLYTYSPQNKSVCSVCRDILSCNLSAVTD